MLSFKLGKTIVASAMNPSHFNSLKLLLHFQFLIHILHSFNEVKKARKINAEKETRAHTFLLSLAFRIALSKLDFLPMGMDVFARIQLSCMRIQ